MRIDHSTPSSARHAAMNTFRKEPRYKSELFCNVWRFYRKPIVLYCIALDLSLLQLFTSALIIVRQHTSLYWLDTIELLATSPVRAIVNQMMPEGLLRRGSGGSSPHCLNRQQCPVCRSAFVFMQTVSCCGLGTDLPSITCAVIHDSDWNPQADLQAISRCLRLGSSPQGCPVFRLVTKGSVEEKLVQMAGGANGMEAIYAAGVGNT